MRGVQATIAGAPVVDFADVPDDFAVLEDGAFGAVEDAFHHHLFDGFGEGGVGLADEVGEVGVAFEAGFDGAGVDAGVAGGCAAVAEADGAGVGLEEAVGPVVGGEVERGGGFGAVPGEAVGAAVGFGVFI